MSNDDFLDGLKGDWQSQQADLRAVSDLAEKGERKLRQERTARLTQMALFFGFCALFAWQVIQTGHFLFHVAAVVFLTAGLIALADFVFLRRLHGEAYLQQTDAVLALAERQARIAMRLAEGMKAHALLLSVCAALMIGYDVFAAAEPGRGFLVGAIIGGSAVFMWVLQRGRRVAALAQQDHFARMRAELGNGE